MIGSITYSNENGLHLKFLHWHKNVRFFAGESYSAVYQKQPCDNNTDMANFYQNSVGKQSVITK